MSHCRYTVRGGKVSGSCLASFHLGENTYVMNAPQCRRTVDGLATRTFAESKPSIYQLLGTTICSFGEHWSDTNDMDLGSALNTPGVMNGSA
jgi:hypothetical protein